jgi:hypothetical protein
MKDSTVLIVVIAGFALIFWAFSKGFLSASPTGLGINPQTGKPFGVVNIPQPSQNYSGYLAASTAPGVSTALNGALSGIGAGLNNLFSGWIGGSSQVQGVNQGAVNPPASAPSAAAQPVGPTAQIFGPFVGPVAYPDVSYNATPGSAFDYAGLAADNVYDPTYSLQDPAFASA